MIMDAWDEELAALNGRHKAGCAGCGCCPRCGRGTGSALPCPCGGPPDGPQPEAVAPPGEAFDPRRALLTMAGVIVASIVGSVQALQTALAGTRACAAPADAARHDVLGQVTKKMARAAEAVRLEIDTMTEELKR